ncbi:hypothetical protein AVEN_81495-1 [Araneus ventricosus]|uniref:Uncharacterized protein n=1 Tax=Araneus ventricosus TaxID=182803 RepID=A0A4Y2E1A0_ARAVE|nr:hypothetical protein AVEN_81495-1 [Araneus ventricosus]
MSEEYADYYDISILLTQGSRGVLSLLGAPGAEVLRGPIKVEEALLKLLLEVISPAAFTPNSWALLQTTVKEDHLKFLSEVISPAAFTLNSWTLLQTTVKEDHLELFSEVSNPAPFAPSSWVHL